MGLICVLCWIFLYVLIPLDRKSGRSLRRIYLDALLENIRDFVLSIFKYRVCFVCLCLVGGLRVVDSEIL